MTQEELTAMRLTEIGMAVSKFEDYASLLSYAKKLGLSVKSSEDVSLHIMPTLRRFERLAKLFFEYPKLAKLTTRIFSREFTYNAVSGLLMPSLIENNLASYYITVLEK